MTQDKFRDLCNAVLLPNIGALMHRQLATLHEETELIANELVRLGNKIDRIAAQLDKSDDAAD